PGGALPPVRAEWPGPGPPAFSTSRRSHDRTGVAYRASSAPPAAEGRDMRRVRPPPTPSPTTRKRAGENRAPLSHPPRAKNVPTRQISVLNSLRKGEESLHKFFTLGVIRRREGYVEARARLFDWFASLRLLRFQDPRPGPGDHRRHRRTGLGSRRRHSSRRQRDHPEHGHRFRADPADRQPGQVPGRPASARSVPGHGPPPL